MEVRTELAALAKDLSPLHRAQASLAAALAGWRDRQGAGLDSALGAFAGGADPRGLAALACLLAPGEAAGESVADLVSTVAAVLKDHPLGLVPLRHYADDGLASLVVARSGGASLSLQALDGSALTPPPLTVSFTPTETWDRILSGGAEIETISARPASPARVDLKTARGTIRPGPVRHRDGRREAQVYLAIPTTLVVLRLQRRFPGPQPTLEYRREDGALVHRAAGNPRDSRFELIAALLGAMKRSDAVPTLVAMASESGNASTRWQALRQALTLDTAVGLATLQAVAADAADDLAPPAGTLLAQLRERHPELDPCLA